MATQSLYRRYRPRRFSEVKGQDHVVRALRNSVAEGREGQAYLFSGPRGTGKTTSARILAKVLNCENPVAGEPRCGLLDRSAVGIEQHDAIGYSPLSGALRGPDDRRECRSWTEGLIPAPDQRDSGARQDSEWPGWHQPGHGGFAIPAAGPRDVRP
jgi:energy-coupling factor transporter ATP-binding protein EcfA2